MSNWNKRRQLKELALFLDGLGMYLAAGYDVRYAWPQTLEALASNFEPSLKKWLTLMKGERPEHALERLAENFPCCEYRPWFSALREHLVQGLALAGCVEALAGQLRAELALNLEGFSRTLPAKTSLILLACFFPATALLLFAPLVLGLGAAFGE